MIQKLWNIFQSPLRLKEWLKERFLFSLKCVKVLRWDNGSSQQALFSITNGLKKLLCIQFVSTDLCTKPKINRRAHMERVFEKLISSVCWVMVTLLLFVLVSTTVSELLTLDSQIFLLNPQDDVKRFLLLSEISTVRPLLFFFFLPAASFYVVLIYRTLWNFTQTIRTKKRRKCSVCNGKYGSVWFPSPCVSVRPWRDEGLPSHSVRVAEKQLLNFCWKPIYSCNSTL